MGLFKKTKLEDPVEGTGMVVSCSSVHESDGTKLIGPNRCGMNLVVQAPGVDATSIEHKGWVWASKWPTPGMTLPLLVDRADPRRVKVLWDKVPKVKDRIDATGDMIAAAMRGQPPMQAPPAGVQMGVDPTASTDRVGQLERVAQLHASGALTDEEFETEKRKVLGT
jgi:hypothetical protein